MPTLCLEELGMETVIERSKLGSFTLVQLAEKALDPRTDQPGTVRLIRCAVCGANVAGGFADVVTVLWAADYEPEASGQHCTVAKA